MAIKKMNKMELNAIASKIGKNIEELSKEKVEIEKKQHKIFIKKSKPTHLKLAKKLYQRLITFDSDIQKLLVKINNYDDNNYRSDLTSRIIKLMITPNVADLVELQVKLLPKPIYKEQSYHRNYALHDEIVSSLIIAQMDAESVEDMIKAVTVEFIK